MDAHVPEARWGLAAARLAEGDRESALRMVEAPAAPNAVAAYAAGLATPELAPLLDLPPLAALRTPSPGSARVALRRGKDLSDDYVVLLPDVSWQPAHKLLAYFAGKRGEDSGCGDCTPTGLTVTDLRGSVITRLDFGTDFDWGGGVACHIQHRPHVAAANRFLSDLGFVRPEEIATLGRGDQDHWNTTARFRRTALTVDSRNGRVRLLRGARLFAAARGCACR